MIFSKIWWKESILFLTWSKKKYDKIDKDNNKAIPYTTNIMGNPAINSWQKNVEAINIVMPKSGCINTSKIKIKNDTKVNNKKYFLSLIDWEIPQEVNIIKKGLITSDGWKEKLSILNHLLEPFSSYSKK